MTGESQEIAIHYTRGNLGDTILAALQEAGRDIDALTTADLAPVDEFHVRGREATIELAQLAGISPDVDVLDVGCGIGGPSRHLARSPTHKFEAISALMRAGRRRGSCRRVCRIGLRQRGCV